MATFEDFISAQDKNSVPEQSSPDWQSYRKELNTIGSSMCSQFFASIHQINNAFNSFINPNDRFNPNFVHGHLIEEINVKFLETILGNKIFPAKTIVSSFASGTTDGYVKVGDKIFTVEIKSPINRIPSGFLLGHLAQMKWCLNLLPEFFHGGLYFSQLWSETIRDNPPFGYIILTLKENIHPIKDYREFLYRLFLGQEWFLESIILTNIGKKYISETRTHLETVLNLELPPEEIMLQSEYQPIPRDQSSSVILTWYGGFFGVFLKASFDAIMQTIGRRFQETVQESGRDNLTSIQLYRSIFSRDFLFQ